MSYQNNTIEALKKLYVAMGGMAADVENLNITPEMISAIADVYQGGGAALPEVTEDDNGKLLTVVEGKWDKAENAGGAVVITLGEESLNTFETALMTFLTAALTNAGTYTISGTGTGLSEYEDIIGAYEAGKRVVIDVGVNKADVIADSENHVVVHIAVPSYTVSQVGEVSMSLDVSLLENAIVIQGFASVNTD